MKLNYDSIERIIYTNLHHYISSTCEYTAKLICDIILDPV